MSNGQVFLHEGDIFETDAPVIIHGCNCLNRMGKGIAKVIAQKFPGAQQVDNATKSGDRKKLGNYTVSKRSNDTVVIVNMYTQFSHTDSKDMFYQDAFETGLEKVLTELNFTDFAMPAIGLGLANGVPSEVFEAIHSIAKSTGKNIHFHVTDEKIRDKYLKWLKEV